MMKLFLLFFLLSTLSFPKEKIRKIIVDNNRHPLAFTNITSIQSNNGIMTNAHGEFTLDADINDTLKFTNIAYQTRLISVKELLMMDTIFLSENVKELTQIFIQNFNLFKTEKEMGFYTSAGSSSFSFGAGSQLAVYLENVKGKEGWIKKINFKIHQMNQCKNNFRIRFLEFDTTTFSPGKDILTENIIIPFDKLKKKNNIDVAEHHIIFPKEGLFVVLEWLDTNEDCSNKKSPTIEANNELTDNNPWVNYRDRKWSSYSFSQRKVGTPKIGISVAYQ